MRTRTLMFVEFDGLERQTLARIEPSIRIAFPTDAIDALADAPIGKVKAAWREWDGWKLKQVCKTRQEWDASAIWDAWDALVTLEAVLDQQSERDYWERELKPQHSAQAGRAQATMLVAPGTDVCGMLAETRGSQLRDVREALEVIERARAAVGPRLADRERI